MTKKNLKDAIKQLKRQNQSNVDVINNYKSTLEKKTKQVQELTKLLKDLYYQSPNPFNLVETPCGEDWETSYKNAENYINNL